MDGVSNLKEFYAGSPESLFHAPPTTAPWADGIAEGLHEYQTSLGLNRTFSGNEPLIITGQQPAYFTGPIYSIHKAITAILLSRKLSALHNVSVLPMFWVGSDDHDFEEAATAHFINRRHEHFFLRYTPQKDIANRSLYHVPLEDSIHEAIDTLTAQCIGSEFAEDIRTMLHDALNTSDSLSDWSTRLLARLFKDTELLFVAPHLPAMRKAAQQVMRQEIVSPLESTRILNEQGAKLSVLNYDVQLVKGENEVNFFVDCNGLRRKVIYEEDNFVFPEEDAHYTEKEMLTLLQDSPERFSPNVVTRCQVQQSVFLCVAYVGGPGEIAYWAQMKPVFRHFNLKMPVVYPRTRVVLSTLKLNKLRNKYGLAYDDLENNPEHLVDNALHNQVKNVAREALAKRKESITQELSNLEADLRNIKNSPPESLDVLKRLEDQVAQGFARIERVLLHADQAQVDTIKNQIERLCTAFAPDGKPQERVYSVYSFLFEHGTGLIQKIMAGVDVENFNVQEIEL
jgi:bacillithiol biosynthesis cysteine-adding enzyme BshC